jgi:pimeloyl-ACP methyl ester carboxylesterase
MQGYAADLVGTRYVDTPDGRLGYRRFGPAGGMPLVLLMRFRGTLDHWDPALLDVLASEREVIVFDNRGTGLSSGDAADSVEGLAAGAVELVRALGLSQVDLLGWSMGGLVAQAVALREPGLVRRLVVAGSGPGGVPELSLPVLVANGAHDVMVHAYASYAMSQRLPNAKIVLYSDAGHGFLFQHPVEFGREVLRFLA